TRQARPPSARGPVKALPLSGVAVRVSSRRTKNPPKEALVVQDTPRASTSSAGITRTSATGSSVAEKDIKGRGSNNQQTPATSKASSKTSSTTTPAGKARMNNS
ncbi:unnamed protein product, partial [Amoebophrya sp. A25]